MPEMVEVGHRQDARAAGAEDFQQQLVDVVELGFKLVEQRVVIVAPGGVADWNDFGTFSSEREM